VEIAQALNQELYELGCLAGMSGVVTTPLHGQIPELALLCKDIFAWGVQQVQLPEVQARGVRRSGSRREVGRVGLSHCRRCHALRHVRFGIHYLGGSPRLRACR